MYATLFLVIALGCFVFAAALNENRLGWIGLAMGTISLLI